MALDTYFKITPPEGETARDWARRAWDTYCFDYLTEMTADTVFAWTDGVSVDQLKAALEADNIEFEIIEAETNTIF